MIGKLIDRLDSFFWTATFSLSWAGRVACLGVLHVVCERHFQRRRNEVGDSELVGVAACVGHRTFQHGISSE